MESNQAVEPRQALSYQAKHFGRVNLLLPRPLAVSTLSWGPLDAIHVQLNPRRLSSQETSYSIRTRARKARDLPLWHIEVVQLLDQPVPLPGANQELQLVW